MQLRRQTEAHRESLTSVLGAPPDDAPLSPQVLEVEELETYRREKIRYQVSPGDWAYAYLLLPKPMRPPLPVIYCHHRHNRDWALGKSEVIGIGGDETEAFGLELVHRGYAIFAPDAIAFEERRPSDMDENDTLAPYMNNLNELSVRLLRGETLLKKIIWDVSRGIDYVETRSEIDKTRIGFMGHGYGAKMAMWAMAFDERIAAGIGHGNVGSMHRALQLEHIIQIEFSVPRLLQVADYDRILSLAAPRPFLLSASKDDPDSEDVESVYDKARRTYARFGIANRLALYHYETESDEPYFPEQSRHRAYDWLDNWLKSY